MPVYSRRELRQQLGQTWLFDTIVGNTEASWGMAGGITLVDASKIDISASGENLFQRHWLRLLGSIGVIQDTRVASFNTGSGAYLGGAMAATTILPGSPFEVHAMLSPADKDRMLTAVIRTLRIFQRCEINSIEQLHTYSLGDEILDVLDVNFYANPMGPQDKEKYGVSWWKADFASSVHELCIQPSLLASHRLVLDTITTMTLGDGDLATIYLPSVDWILAGTAARCFWLLEQQSPGKEGAIYRNRRLEMAREFTRLSARFQPFISRRIMLSEHY